MSHVVLTLTVEQLKALDEAAAKEKLSREQYAASVVAAALGGKKKGG